MSEQEPRHIRVGGVEVTIWTNEGNNGTYNTVSMQRNYKNKDDEWSKTTSLRAGDIPKAILALQKAYEELVIKE